MNAVRVSVDGMGSAKRRAASLGILLLIVAAAALAWSALGAEEIDQPAFVILEYPKMTITQVRAETNQVFVSEGPDTNSVTLRVSPKTWIVKDEKEASLADLRIGQSVRVRYVPKGSQAVTLEVLSIKDVGKTRPTGPQVGEQTTPTNRDKSGWAAADQAALSKTLRALELSDEEIAQVISSAKGVETASALNDFALDPIKANGLKGKKAMELIDTYLKKLKNIK
jgi:hypothetical protein